MLPKALILLLTPVLFVTLAISGVHAEGTIIQVTGTNPGREGSGCTLKHKTLP